VWSRSGLPGHPGRAAASRPGTTAPVVVPNRNGLDATAEPVASPFRTTYDASSEKRGCPRFESGAPHHHHRLLGAVRKCPCAPSRRRSPSRVRLESAEGLAVSTVFWGAAVSHPAIAIRRRRTQMQANPRAEVINHPRCEEVVNHRAVPPRYRDSDLTTPSHRADFGREVDAHTRDRPSPRCQKTHELQAKPSVGLEPTTPSLPWKVQGFTSVH
jgi:hypothetical protein